MSTDERSCDSLGYADLTRIITRIVDTGARKAMPPFLPLVSQASKRKSEAYDDNPHASKRIAIELDDEDGDNKAPLHASTHETSYWGVVW